MHCAGLWKLKTDWTLHGNSLDSFKAQLKFTSVVAESVTQWPLPIYGFPACSSPSVLTNYYVYWCTNPDFSEWFVGFQWSKDGVGLYRCYFSEWKTLAATNRSHHFIQHTAFMLLEHRKMSLTLRHLGQPHSPICAPHVHIFFSVTVIEGKHNWGGYILGVNFCRKNYRNIIITK